MNWDLITLILNIISLISMSISFYYLNQINKDFKEKEEITKTICKHCKKQKEI